MRIVPGIVVGIADDPKDGMTLEELAAFVQWAMRSNTPMNSKVECTANWRGGIRKLEVPQGFSPQEEMEMEVGHDL